MSTNSLAVWLSFCFKNTHIIINFYPTNRDWWCPLYLPGADTAGLILCKQHKVKSTAERLHKCIGIKCFTYSHWYWFFYLLMANQLHIPIFIIVHLETEKNSLVDCHFWKICVLDIFIIYADERTEFSSPGFSTLPPPEQWTDQW